MCKERVVETRKSLTRRVLLILSFGLSFTKIDRTNPYFIFDSFSRAYVRSMETMNGFPSYAKLPFGVRLSVRS